MAISIPSNITLNRREYSIGEMIKLDDGDLPATEDHPFVVLCLKYIAAPVSSEAYNLIEEHFLNYLDVGLMERIAEDDVDFVFDKEEYSRHKSSVRDYMENLTLKSLMKKLEKYGIDKKIISFNIKGTESKGLDIGTRDFSTLDGRQKALSYNMKGIESSKINTAIKRNVPYRPILEYFADAGHSVGNYETKIDKVTELPSDTIDFRFIQPVEVKIKLTNRKTKLGLEGSLYILTLDFGLVFDKLFEDWDMKPIQAGAKRTKPFKKAFKKFTFHPDNPIKNDLLQDQINALFEFNEILATKVFDTDEDGIALDDEKRKMAIKEGEFDSELKKLDNLRRLGLITEDKYNKFKEGKRYTSFPVSDGLKNIIQENMNFKMALPENKDKDKDTFFNDIEIKIQGEKSKKKGRAITDEIKIENSGIISAPPSSSYSERNFFMNESWKKPEEVKLNFEAVKYNRELKSLFDDALIPSRTVLMLDLIVIKKEKNKQALTYLDEEDKREMDNRWLDVVRLHNYTTKTSKYDAATLREIRPSFVTNTSKLEDERQKHKVPSKQGRVPVSTVDEEGNKKSGARIAAEKAKGEIDAGLPRKNYNANLSAFMFYIMRQANKLERYLGGQIIEE